ncbi:MAG: GH3 auxin-responsive promoter family protein, partial [Planctomycetota bacterium]|nr:GH3 auxin-responsive promoter family protein [Planctomycetota bacterium]
MPAKAGPIGAAIGVGLKVMLARRVAALSDANRWARNARAMQTAALRDILTAAAKTEFGRAKDFSRIAALPESEQAAAFRKAVKINTYDDLLPMLRRMREDAEPDVAWPGVVRDWAQTSGTTAGDKYVPVSRALLKHNWRAALDVYANAQRFGVSIPSMYTGKVLFLGGSTDLTTSDKGVRTGDLSGVVTRLIRWPMTMVYLPGKDIALMSDWPAKIDAMARRCIDQDVRALSGMPSWTLALFERMIALRTEQGRPVASMREIWPNLNLFIHGGTRYPPFEDRVREVWSGRPGGDDIPIRLEVYAASEAFVAMQDIRHDPGMRLNVDLGVFFEFVPAEQIHDESPDAFLCDEVEKGQRYVVVMTTCAGLWRYIIGDVVEFDTIPPDGPPRLRIVGRHRHFINAFGENIIVEHVENAVVA